MVAVTATTERRRVEEGDSGQDSDEDRKKMGEKDTGHDTDEECELITLDKGMDRHVEREIVWGNVIKFIALNLVALYSLYNLPSLCYQSWAWLLLTYMFAAMGITAGAHRLWSHRAYKAKFPLRVFLMVANSMAGENSIYIWSRDHRLHHKCSETRADPHDANRGFFFSHVGWLLQRKHPAVKEAGKKIIMTDLEQDSVVMFQHKHYLAFFLSMAFILPTVLPHILWGESLLTAYYLAVLRYVAVLHSTWLVNSAAHMFGMKPYDRTIGPVENRLVSFLAVGEGFHNYHHTFPYDYRTSEWGFRLNLTSVFLDAMAAIGQAYNLRTASPATIEARAARTGVPELTRKGVEEMKAR